MSHILPEKGEVAARAKRLIRLQEKEQLRKIRPLKNKRSIIVVFPPPPAPPFELEI